VGHGPSLASAGDEEQGRAAVKPERWQEVKKVLAAALEREPGERAVYLDKACADPSLRREVESLIAAHEQGESSFMEQPAIEGGALKTGTRLGVYEILAALGRGGMGEVYEARDTKLGRNVAIKVLPTIFMNEPQRLARFQREARMLASLNHPNIATIYGLEQYESVHYLIMELVRGETLAKRLGAGALSVHEVLDISVQCADALDAAHAQGVIHRDIKPANIIVTDRGRVKMLDFGLAKITPHEVAASSSKTTALTVPGAAVGTVAYMSPEQVRGEELDSRTDLFSFGVVLYEMATGLQPFRGKSSGTIQEAILNRAPIPAGRLNPELSSKLEEIIGKALEKDRKLRYQHSSDLRADLQRLKRDTDWARSVTPNEVIRADGTGRWRRRKTALAAAGIALALSALGTWFAVSQSRGGSIDSVAVLPFANSTSDLNTEYLSDGISESLINNLAQLRGLRVMAPTTVFRYKGKDQDAQKIGHDLGVRAVLTGRLVQRNDTLTVQTELVDVDKGSELWGAQYNRKLADLLAMQEDISREISLNLKLRLTGEEKQRLTKHYPENAQAYQSYLKGRYFWNKRTEADIRTAISYFQQAVAEDPQYALAYSGLADAYHVLPVYSDVRPKETHEQAQAAALKAVQIDDTLAEGHTSLAAIAADDDWDFAAAERSFRAAIALSPNYAVAHQWYAELLSYVGRFDEGLNEIRKARELDPLSIIVSVNAGQILMVAGRYDEAIVQLRETIDLDKGFPLTHRVLRDVYEYKHMFPEAIAENETAAVAQGDPAEQASGVAAGLREAYASGGERGYWRARLRRAEQNIKEGKAMNYDESPLRIASLYAHIGDSDSAVRWLRQALEQRDIALTFVRSAPEFQSLRSDPRVTSIMRQAGFLQ
jgi:eukaryotic-like serine/threonine-protein kinase